MDLGVGHGEFRGRKGMMNALTRVCFTVCIVCIVAAVVVSLFLIWGQVESDSVWRCLVSIGVFFLASLLTVGVASIVEPRLGQPKEG